MVRFLIISLCMLSSLPAGAARVERARLGDLVRGADLVLVGRPLERQSYWQGGRILTRVRLAVDELWSGELTESTVEVVTLGGVVGDLGQQVAGEAVVPTSGRVVLFLSGSTLGLRVLGMAQGLLLVSESDGTPARVTRRLDGLDWLERGVAEPFPALLDDLRARVAELRRAP